MSVIEQILLDIVISAFPESLSLFEYPQKSSISLDVPPKKELGDFAFNIFPYAKVTKLAPPAIAEKVAEALRSRPEYFKDVSIMGGYVNFFLTNASWKDIFDTLSTDNKPAKNETVVVDYIGANAGKPLHIGHICTPSIGQAILNTHAYLGYDTIGDSHFGDWGGIFGKLIWAWNNLINELSYYEREINTLQQTKKVHFKQWDKQEQEAWKNEKIETDWVNLLLWLYWKFHVGPCLDSDKASLGLEILNNREEWARKEFQYLSWVGIDLTNPEEKKHHEENVELWKKFTAISIAEVNKKLELINVQPKYNIGESFYEGLNLPRPNNEEYPLLNGENNDKKCTMKDIVRELVKKWVAIQNEDGSVGVVFPEETKIPSCVLQKKDGTGLYLTSDLAAIKYRLTNGWNPSKIVYCVDSRQQLHLKQAFMIARMAWPELLGNTELFHAFNGFIKLKEGAMSTRKGTVIFLSDLITEGFNRTKAIIEEKGQSLSDADIEAISIGAIKYSYLAQDREKDVVFDWDKALSFEGNSGPYIQYSFVRAKNIVEKACIELEMWKNDKIRLKNEHCSESYDLYGERGAQGLNANIEVISHFTLSEYDRACLRRLSFFDKAVMDSATKYKPHILATYCYELASEFNAFYVHTPKILEEQDVDLRNFRLKLIEKVSETLEKGFELLAIKMPKKM